MPIEVTCDACFQTFTVGSQHAGKRGKCPECGESVVVHRSSSAPATRQSSGSLRGGARKRKRQQKSSVPVIAIVGGALALVVVVGVAAFLIGRGGGNDDQQVAANDLNTPDQGTPANPSSTGPNVNGIAQPPSSQIKPVSDKQDGQITSATPPTTTDNAKSNASTKTLSTKELVALVQPSVVRINAVNEKGELEWHGSGFIIDESGVIATNRHVVAGALKCVVEFSDKKSYPVQGYYKMDDKLDIAIIKVELPTGYRALPLANSPSEQLEKVVAFGCPYGLDFTITDGTVSTLRSATDIKKMLGREVEGDWVQTSAPISPGNSGGPLVNMRGEVIGINSMVRSEGQNLNFAISANDVKEMFASRGDKVTALSRATDLGKNATPTAMKNSEAAKQYLAKIDAVLSGRSAKIPALSLQKPRRPIRLPKRPKLLPSTLSEI